MAPRGVNSGTTAGHGATRRRLGDIEAGAGPEDAMTPRPAGAAAIGRRHGCVDANGLTGPVGALARDATASGAGRGAARRLRAPPAPMHHRRTR